MTWLVEFDDQARRELRALDPQTQRQILRYLKERIATDEDPKRFGKALTGDKLGLWRYRVNDYRIVCQIEDSKLTVLVLRAAHRREVYDD